MPPPNPYASPQYNQANPYAGLVVPGSGPKAPTNYRTVAPGVVAPLVGGPDDLATIRAQTATRAGTEAAISAQRAKEVAAYNAALELRTNAGKIQQNVNAPVPRNQQFDNISGLRKELESQNSVKVYKGALPSYASALQSPETPAGDQDMIYAFAKIMDPNSVVREGEANSVADLGTMGQKIYGELQKQLGEGGRFTPELRAQLRNTLATRVGAYNKAYTFERSRFRDLSTKQGIDPDLVVGPHMGDSVAKIENEYFRHDPNKSAAAARADAAAKGDGGASVFPIIPGSTPATGGAHSQQMDPQNAALITGMIRQNMSLDQINGVLKAANIGSIDGEALETARKSIAAGGSLTAQYQAPNSLWNKIASSPAGVGALAAADAGLGGFTDEAAGAFDWARGKGNLSDLVASRNAAKQAGYAADPKSAFAGQAIGNIGSMALTGGLLKGTALAGALGRAAPYAGNAAFGAAEGLGQNNDNRLLGAAIGAGAGLVGTGLGEIASVPINAALRTRPGMAFSAGARQLRDALPGGSRFDNSAPTFAPRLSPGEGAAASVFDKSGPGAIRDQLDEASRLGLPFTLADTSPEARELVAAGVRRSPAAAQTAENVLLPRNRGQIDRLGSAVSRDLGPVSNIPQTSADLMEQARTAAAPLYEKAYAARAVGSPELDSLLQTPFGKQAVSRAHTIAANERRNPMDLGFSLGADGDVILNPVRADLYGAQATARTAVSDAQQAYKAALRVPGADRSAAAQRLIDAREALTKADGDLAASPSAGTAATGPQYSPQTLDYVKRGMDDVLEQHRNPLTGKLVLDEAGRAQNDVKAKLLGEIDKLNPDYAAARRAYAGPSQSRDALARGQDALSLSPDELGMQVAGQTPEQLAQMQLGYRSGLMDRANSVRDGSNPWEATLGNPNARARVDTLHPENPGTNDLFRSLEIERQMARTTNDVLGNSKTAQRNIADQAFLGPKMDAAVDIGSTVATGGWPVLPAAKLGVAGLKNVLKLGADKRAVAKAEELAPMFLNPDPTASSATVEDIMRKLAERRAFEARQNFTRPAGMFGAGFSVAAPNSYSPF